MLVLTGITVLVALVVTLEDFSIHKVIDLVISQVDFPHVIQILVHLRYLCLRKQEGDSQIFEKMAHIASLYF